MVTTIKKCFTKCDIQVSNTDLQVQPLNEVSLELQTLATVAGLLYDENEEWRIYNAVTISREIGRTDFRKIIKVSWKNFCIYNQNFLKRSIKICTIPGHTLLQHSNVSAFCRNGW